MFNSGEEKNIWKTTGYFIVVAAGAFFITFSILYVFGLVPDTFMGERTHTVQDTRDYIVETFGGADDVEDTPEVITTNTRPERIQISKIGVDSIIGQPTSRDVSILDQFLNRGAVHYPGSGSIEEGNIFLFGHSASAFLTQNPVHTTFNDLEKLNRGDKITLTAEGETYTYKVTSVQLMDENTALVDFSKSEKMLTISTCNTFGEKQERWVVEAKFEG